MGKIDRLLQLASKVGIRKKDKRRFFLGAVGERKDGTLVYAYNGSDKVPCPRHHCEFRLARKLDKGSMVYLSRTLADGTLGLSKPCPSCEIALRSAGCVKVYYSVCGASWDCLELS